MPKVIISLTKSEIRSCRAIWSITKKHIRKDVRKSIGWIKMEDFLADLLRFGIEKASDDPVGFIRDVREEKDPLFIIAKKKGAPSRDVSTEWKKAYA